jgi:hypothetical protein
VYLLTIETKIYLKNSGRPVPKLNVVQEQKQQKNKVQLPAELIRLFIKKKTPWICGCEETNAYFCFVCLLFGGDDKWTKKGVCDLKHLVTKINNHEGSKKT